MAIDLTPGFNLGNPFKVITTKFYDKTGRLVPGYNVTKSQYKDILGPYFEKGLSFEDMNKITGISLKDIAEFSNQRYPGYGIPTNNTSVNSSTTSSGGYSDGNLSYSGGYGGGYGGGVSAESIAGVFDPIYDWYEKYADKLKTYQQNDEKSLGAQYTALTSDANTKAQQAREKVETNQQKALRDLENNLRQAFRAGQIKLGNYGAGDSSAVGQYSYALTRMSDQNRGDIRHQTSQLMGDIENNLSNILSQLGMWRDNSLNELRKWYRSQRDELERQKANLDAQKAQAITSQQIDLARSAVAAAQNINSTAEQALRNYAPDLTSGANQTLKQLSGVTQAGEKSSALPALSFLNTPLDLRAALRSGGLTIDQIQPRKRNVYDEVYQDLNSLQ